MDPQITKKWTDKHKKKYRTYLLEKKISVKKNHLSYQQNSDKVNKTHYIVTQ